MVHFSTARFQQASPVRFVWAHNLEYDFTLIHHFAQSYTVRFVWAHNLEYDFTLILKGRTMVHFSTARFQQASPVRFVWAHNLEYDFTLIHHFAQSYTFATIDTEFPGVMYEAPTHPQHMSPHHRYALVKKNVDCLKLIQLGITLCTSDSGDGAFTTWEFNFQGFIPLQDQNASSSIQLLESQGINLWMNYYDGIDPQKFRCLMLSKMH